MEIYFSVLLAVVGLLVGSFLNVVIARVPEGSPSSHRGLGVPRCQTEISARDNIPVVSWLLLRGRCRSLPASRSACATPWSSWRTSALWLAMLWRFGWELRASGLPLLRVRRPGPRGHRHRHQAPA